jgi:hypothetical protein
MIGTAAALLGSAAIGAGASLFGSSKAADAQKDAANNALAFQQQTYNNNQKNLSPYMSAGSGAANLLSKFYGLDGNGLSADGMSNVNAFFQNSPDYKFAVQEGQSALENSAAARSGNLNGNALRAAQSFGQGLATQNLGGYLGRIQGIAGMGASAAGSAANTNTEAAKQVGNTMQNAGQAEASGYVGAANGVNSFVNNLQLYNERLNRSSYGGGSSMGGSFGGGYNGNQIGGLF